jgi:hypothetical protein
LKSKAIRILEHLGVFKKSKEESIAMQGDYGHTPSYDSPKNNIKG